MIIWFDTVTAKEPLLFNALALELEKEGHETLFTCKFTLWKINGW
jgi:predicted glycosyltransferase